MDTETATHTETFEIVGRFGGEGDAGDLLYAPPEGELRYQRTGRYEISFGGDPNAVTDFVHRTLFDPFSQELHQGGGPAVEGFAFAIDYGMKPGSLDLEKEAVLDYYRTLASPGFDLVELRHRTRVYIFGEGADPAPFIKDICNPAIHQWEVIGS